MSYEKLNLESGQVLTAAALAHIEDGIANAIPLQSITYAELIALRDAQSLTPGMQYRITDYVTTTTQANTKSANHPFDLIVIADDESTLNEKARAIQHDGDEYFANSDLAAWEIWYCLDNDTDRFAWADAENGKGVIYRMIDEFNNDVPYDFKNIAFGEKLLIKASFVLYGSSWDGELQRDSENDTTIDSIPYYAWKAVNVNGPSVSTIFYSTTEGLTLESVMYTISSDVVTVSSAITLLSVAIVDITTFRDDLTGGAYNNIIRPYKSDGAYKINHIIFGNSCHSNSFGSDCYSNSFGRDCYSNSFGNSCHSNSFGSGCHSNSFGNSCHSNSFGNSCHSNSFGSGCHSNSFGSGCFSNSFGSDCHSNSFGSDCYSNSFGNSCHSNSFGNYSSSNSFGSGCRSNSLDDGNESTSVEIQNYKFANGTEDAEPVVTRGLAYETMVAKDSEGNLKVFCLADLVTE